MILTFSLLLFQNIPGWSSGQIRQIKNSFENKSFSQEELRAGGLVWFEERVFRQGPEGMVCDIKLIKVILRDDIHPMLKALHLSKMSGQSELKNVEAWIQFSYGGVEFRDQDQIIQVSMAEGDAVNFDIHKAILFPEARKGSIIVAQWTEVAKPYLGSIAYASPAAALPSKTFRCRAEEGKVQSGPQLKSKLKRDGEWYILRNIDPNQEEVRTGFWVSFSDDSTKQYKDWNTYATWYYRVFREAAESAQEGEIGLGELKKVLRALSSDVIYRQVYLDPARGWVPERGLDVWQKGYGDCKDLVAAVYAKFPKEKHPILPVLANINGAPQIGEQDPSFPTFNHLIGAYKLSEPLDAPAVVETERGPILLFDPTADQCEFGFLPAYYKDHKVMVCFSDGASFVDVPDSALEPNRFLVELNGIYTNDQVQGTLSISAKGNPYGFRDIVDSQHRDIVQRFVRTIFKIPSHVKLNQLERREYLYFELVWQQFLNIQGDRLFLPQDIVGLPSHQEPEYPLTRPQIQWKIHLQGAPIKNRITESWQDAQHQVSITGSNNDLQYTINLEFQPNTTPYKPQLKDQQAFLRASWPLEP